MDAHSAIIAMALMQEAVAQSPDAVDKLLGLGNTGVVIWFLIWFVMPRYDKYVADSREDKQKLFSSLDTIAQRLAELLNIWKEK